MKATRANLGGEMMAARIKTIEARMVAAGMITERKITERTMAARLTWPW